MAAQNEKCTNTGTERHGPLHYSLDEAIMSQKQFEVVKCLFLAWNHLWCFRVLSLFVFRVCLLRSLWYPQLKLTADLPSISRRGMWINIYHFRPCLLVENYSNYIHAMSWMNRVILRLLVPSKS